MASVAPSRTRLTVWGGLMTPSQGAASRSGASDLQPPLLAALSSCWLGDAESLTVARAIAKESSHSVVAAVASDCAALYEAAGRCPGDSDLHAKIRTYAAFKVQSYPPSIHRLSIQLFLPPRQTSETNLGSNSILPIYCRAKLVLCFF